MNRLSVLLVSVVLLAGVGFSFGNLNTVEYEQNYTVRSTGLQDVVFGKNGTRMYTTTSNADVIVQYNLDTPWDVSTASYIENISSQHHYPTALALSPDGTKLYEGGDPNIYEYDLSNPWELSSASYKQSKTGVSDEDVEGLDFSPDGKTVFALIGDGVVSEYSLSSAWDISTLSATDEFDVFNEYGGGLFVKDTGDYMFTGGWRGSEKLLARYSLSGAWDVSTASYIENISSYDGSGVYLSPDGSSLYEAQYKNSGDNYIHQYSLNSAPGVSLNYPSDGASGVSLDPELNVTVTDADGDQMNVSIYKGDGTELYSETGVSNGSDVTYEWSGLDSSTTYEWYAEATDGSATTTSDTWNFTTLEKGVTIIEPSGETSIASEETLKFNNTRLGGDYDIYIDSSLEETVNVAENGSYTATYSGLSYSNHSFYVEYSSDSYSNDSATFNLIPYNITGYGYDSSVYETTENHYQLNLTYDPALSINTSINIFSSSYQAQETDTGVYDVNVTAPLLTSQSNSTESFTWDIERSDGVTNTTTSHSQDRILAYYPAGFSFQSNVIESENYNITSLLTDHIQNPDTDIDTVIALGNDSATGELVTGSNKNYTVELTMPVEKDASQNYTLTSNHTLSYGGNSRQVQSTKTVTVWRFELNASGDADDLENLVVTPYKEENPDQNISDVTFKVRGKLWLNGGVLKRNVSLVTTGDKLDLYFYPNNVSYADVFAVDLRIIAEKDKYNQRELIIKNEHIGIEGTTNYKQYLLNETISDLLTVKAVDETGNPLTSYRLKILRWNYEQEKYVEVASSYTNSLGEIKEYIHPNEIYYKFIMMEPLSDTVILESEDQKITSPEVTLTASLSEGIGEDWNNILGKNVNCEYENSTEVLSCKISSDDGEITDVKLHAYEKDIYGNLNRTCLVNGSGALTELECNVSDTDLNKTTLYWEFYGSVDGSWYLLETGEIGGGSEDPLTIADVSPKQGLILSIALFMTVAMFGVVKPTLEPVAGAIAILSCKLLGILNITNATVFGLMTIVGVVVVYLRR